MDKKVEVKEEEPLADDVPSLNEREFLHEVVPMNTSINTVLVDTDCNMTAETEVNSETSFIKHSVEQVKTESATCSNNWEMHGETEIEHHTLFSDFGSENAGEFLLEDPLMLDNKYNRDDEMYNKIEIKVEPWTLEREPSSVSDNIKDGDLFPVKSSRLNSQGVSEEREIFDSLIHSKLGVLCQMEQIPTHLKTAKVAVTSYECGRSEKSFKLKCEPRPYKCDKCEKSFKCKSHLDLHIFAHSDTRPYKCAKCEKTFKFKCHLDLHIVAHSDTRPYKCGKCEKSFKWRSNLNQHILLHSDTRSYKCNKCERSFKQKSNLDHHVRLHSDTRPFKCYKCEKSFKQKAGLNQHLQLHSDTRSYTCNKCEKTFKQKPNLALHIRLHSDTRPYKCDICEKTFKWKSNLDQHILLHSDTRP